jgi:hypothetical protein
MEIIKHLRKKLKTLAEEKTSHELQCSWISGIHIVKISMSLKVSIDSMQSPPKYQ